MLVAVLGLRQLWDFLQAGQLLTISVASSFLLRAERGQGPASCRVSKAQKKSGSSQQASSTQVPAPYWPLAQANTLGQAPEGVCLGRTWWL